MEILNIEISKIKPNPLQPRREFDEIKLKELANSIRKVGVISPIIVKVKGTGYEIVAGERRWRASQLAKKRDIPAIVREYDDKNGKSNVESLIDNIQREDLTEGEKYDFLQRIMKDDGITDIKELAKKTGMSKRGIEQIIDVTEFRKKYPDIVKVGQKIIRTTKGLTEDDRIAVVRLADKKGISGSKMEQVLPTLKKSSDVMKHAILKDEITFDQAKDIMGLSKQKQEIAITSIKQIQRTIDQIPKSVRDDKVFKKEKKTAVDVINKLKSELSSTTGKMMRMSDVLDGFHEKKVFDVIPQDYKDAVFDILNELKNAEKELSASIQTIEENLK